ncbi:hypothetical protein SAMN04489867_2274 [Pedococcus dokdonensis]|uniref:Uncharacterized protein n=1 Tax=Pedococcus dokdonensis TaxID=443156 RepID=A0A1H0SAF8_9MICO|nr:hypothetical protein [Pedococcus dokdonensis]SDP38753.1 hypothetical protein SAMN04489867_2274 [Pedococcus dokdonensis]
MTDWIWLDPHELAWAGVLLRDVSQELIGSTQRTRTACCAPGLGRHAGPLMAEADTVVRQVDMVTEIYLRLAIDVLQRAIAAVQSQQMGSVVGSVGSVSSAIIGGTTVGGFVLGATSPVTTSVVGGVTLGGLVYGGSDGSSLTTSVVGGTMVGGLVYGTGSPSPSAVSIGGGYYHGGGSGMASGVMALAGAAQASQERQQAILARMKASAGGGVSSTDLGAQMLAKMNTDAARKRFDETEVKIAANQPFAGIVQAENADALDGGNRARVIEDQKRFEQKFYEDKFYDDKRDGL